MCRTGLCACPRLRPAFVRKSFFFFSLPLPRSVQKTIFLQQQQLWLYNNTVYIVNVLYAYYYVWGGDGTLTLFLFLLCTVLCISVGIPIMSMLLCDDKKRERVVSNVQEIPPSRGRRGRSDGGNARRRPLGCANPSSSAEPSSRASCFGWWMCVISLSERE